jgi:MoaA/NifB/PqqE/SkfB family radical SAM enzyme
VFAGAGEPLLRSDVFASAADQLRDAVEVRVVTNGLFPTTMVNDTLVGRVSKATIAVNAHDEATYAKVMAPESVAGSDVWLPNTCRGEPKGRLATVHAFVLACREAGLSVEVTCVERELVDVEAVRSFAAGCGASFRTRPFFP